MNAKLCKALRRQARAETVGMPASRLIGEQIKNGKGFLRIKAVNDPRSTRGRYRALKKEARRKES